MRRLLNEWFQAALITAADFGSPPRKYHDWARREAGRSEEGGAAETMKREGRSFSGCSRIDVAPRRLRSCHGGQVRAASRLRDGVVRAGAAHARAQGCAAGGGARLRGQKTERGGFEGFGHNSGLASLDGARRRSIASRRQCHTRAEVGRPWPA